MRYLFIIGILILSSIQVFANKDAGNGGDVVACRNSQNDITSIEMLDYYEARELRQIQIELNVPDFQTNMPEAVQGAALKIVERIRKVNPFRADKYARYLNSFFAETLFVTGKVLTDIPDSDHLFLPSGCQIEQIAIQQIPRYAQDPRYVINKDLWVHLPFRDAVGLLLHEVIYREMISAGFVNSIPARYFNSLISSHIFENMAPMDYIQLAARIPLPDFDYRGLTLAICYPEIVNDELIPCRKIIAPSFNSTLDIHYVVPARAPWADRRQQTILWNENVLPVEGEIQFRKTGFPSFVNLSEITKVRFQGGILYIAGGPRELKDREPHNADCDWDWESTNCNSKQRVVFRNTGDLDSFILYNSENILELNSCNYGPVTLFENGALESCNLTPTLFETDRYRVQAQGPVSFNQDGSLSSALIITEGVLFLKNPDQTVTEIREFVDGGEMLMFKTNHGVKLNLSGDLTTFGPGEFVISKGDQKLHRFVLNDGGFIRVLHPKEFFPNGAEISAGQFQVENQIPYDISLFYDTPLNSPSGSHIYPAQSRIQFDEHGLVTHCIMSKLPNSACYLR